MTLRRRALLLVAVCLSVLLPRCAAGPSPQGAPAAAPTPRAVSVPAFASPADAEAALLELEDRRAFDEGILTAAAASHDAPGRSRAALAIGRIGEIRGEPLLRRLLSDSSPEVRASAAFGCQLMRDPGMTSDLTPLLSDSDPRVAARAARAVGFLSRGDGEDALAAAIPRAAAPQPRAAMLEALWRFSNEAVSAAAVPYASDPDREVRAAALYALSRKPLESSRAVLTAALADPNVDPDAAAYAARALGVLGRKEALEPLARALDGPRTPVIINTLLALEAILEKDPGGALSADRKQRIIALSGDANANVAVPALILMRQFAADREAFRRLWSVATTGEGRRRQVALQSVTAVLKLRADKALEAAASSPDAALRASAAEALVFLPAADARPWRERFASDKDVRVRFALANTLTTVEAARANRPLINSLVTDADPGVRAAAVEALASLGDPSVLALIADAVSRARAEPAFDVEVAAIAACEKLMGSPGARPIVESIYRGPKTLPARLARRSLVQTFRADTAAFPEPEYKTGRTRADYTALAAPAQRTWQAQVETAHGSFAIRLAGEAAPETVMNFVTLAGKHFFDGVSIHRVVPNFVLQDGDPTGTGNGGPGYEIRDEINAIPYLRGTVGMALAGPDTGGSQWFVTHAPQPHLDGIYTVFGQVVAGQDVVDRTEQGEKIVRVTVAEVP